MTKLTDDIDVSRTQQRFQAVKILEVVYVVDGDTFDLRVDSLFGQSYQTRFRLKYYDTPETWRPKTRTEDEHGEKATAFVVDFFREHAGNLWLDSHKAAVYGRWEAHIYAIVPGQEKAVILGQQLALHDLLKRKSYSDAQ